MMTILTFVASLWTVIRLTLAHHPADIQRLVSGHFALHLVRFRSVFGRSQSHHSKFQSASCNKGCRLRGTMTANDPKRNDVTVAILPVSTVAVVVSSVCPDIVSFWSNVPIVVTDQTRALPQSTTHRPHCRCETDKSRYSNRPQTNRPTVLTQHTAYSHVLAFKLNSTLRDNVG